jgi:hypothetical protein
VLDEPPEQLLAVPAPLKHPGNHFGCEKMEITTKLQEFGCLNR